MAAVQPHDYLKVSVAAFFAGAIMALVGIPMSILGWFAVTLVLGYVGVTALFVISFWFGVKALRITRWAALWLAISVPLFALFANWFRQFVS